MNDVPAKHRHSIRLKGWDYSRAGMYSVTICAQNRVCLFGDVVDGDMRLNDAGRMVEKWWSELNHKFPTVQTHEFVVMPNHVHGIIAIVGADLRVCPDEPGTHIDADAYTNMGAHTDEGRRIISTRSIKTTMKIATLMTIFLRSQNVISRLGYAPGVENLHSWEVMN